MFDYVTWLCRQYAGKLHNCSGFHSVQRRPAVTAVFTLQWPSSAEPLCSRASISRRDHSGLWQVSCLTIIIIIVIVVVVVITTKLIFHLLDVMFCTAQDGMVSMFPTCLLIILDLYRILYICVRGLRLLKFRCMRLIWCLNAQFFASKLFQMRMNVKRKLLITSACTFCGRPIAAVHNIRSGQNVCYCIAGCNFLNCGLI